MNIYWTVKLANNTWIGPDGSRSSRASRRQFTRREALRFAADFETESRLVRVTRKAKAPEPLKVGDTILVEAVVRELDPGTLLDVKLSVGNHGAVWASAIDCRRIKVKS